MQMMKYVSISDSLSSNQLINEMRKELEAVRQERDKLKASNRSLTVRVWKFTNYRRRKRFQCLLTNGRD